jgi:hypothetical protein
MRKPQHKAVHAESGATSHTSVCENCGRSGSVDRPLARCKVCRLFCFCNRACQKGIWSIHRRKCTPPPSTAVADPVFVCSSSSSSVVESSCSFPSGQDGDTDMTHVFTYSSSTVSTGYASTTTSHEYRDYNVSPSSALSIKDLKVQLQSLGVDTTGCLEKSDLVALLDGHNPGNARTTQPSSDISNKPVGRGSNPVPSKRTSSLVFSDGDNDDADGRSHSRRDTSIYARTRDTPSTMRSYICPHCEVENISENSRCWICDRNKPSIAVPPSQYGGSLSVVERWRCSQCNFTNDEQEYTCNVCNNLNSKYEPPGLPSKGGAAFFPSVYSVATCDSTASKSSFSDPTAKPTTVSKGKGVSDRAKVGRVSNQQNIPPNVEVICIDDSDEEPVSASQPTKSSLPVEPIFSIDSEQSMATTQQQIYRNPFRVSSGSSSSNRSASNDARGKERVDSYSEVHETHDGFSEGKSHSSARMNDLPSRVVVSVDSDSDSGDDSDDEVIDIRKYSAPTRSNSVGSTLHAISRANSTSSTFSSQPSHTSVSSSQPPLPSGGAANTNNSLGSSSSTVASVSDAPPPPLTKKEQDKLERKRIREADKLLRQVAAEEDKRTRQFEAEYAKQMSGYYAAIEVVTCFEKTFFDSPTGVDIRSKLIKYDSIQMDPAITVNQGEGVIFWRRKKWQGTMLVDTELRATGDYILLYMSGEKFVRLVQSPSGVDAIIKMCNLLREKFEVSRLNVVVEGAEGFIGKLQRDNYDRIRANEPPIHTISLDDLRVAILTLTIRGRLEVKKVSCSDEAAEFIATMTGCIQSSPYKYDATATISWPSTSFVPLLSS